MNTYKLYVCSELSTVSKDFRCEWNTSLIIWRAVKTNLLHSLKKP